MAPPEKAVILIPALNEEAGLGKVIDDIPIEHFQELGFAVNVMVIDGNSVDRTSEIAASKGVPIYIQEGNGKGNGVRQVLALCNPYDVVFKALSKNSNGVPDPRLLAFLLDSKYILMIDGDYTYPSRYLLDATRALRNGNDVVMGSRFRGGIMPGAMTKTNYIGNLLLSGVASFLFMHPCSDVCTGLWGFRTDALRRMKLGSNNFELEAEMFAVSAKNKMRIKEIPITYYPREGESKLVPIKAGMEIFWKLIEKRLR